MLIDRTYFIGHLNIPYNGSDDVATIEKIDTFIEWHEEEFLRKLLGNAFYASFSEGLMADPIESKWSDLLGRVVEGLGTVTSASVLTNTALVVGRGQSYDPVQGNVIMTLPPAYVGKRLKIDQRGFGELDLNYDYSIAGNELTLLRSIFSNGDRYYISTPDANVTQGSGLVKRSMIANYVYFFYQQDHATQTGGVGEVLTKTENAQRTSPEDKMVFAWNEMCEKAGRLQRWLTSQSMVYPTWGGVHNYPWQYRGWVKDGEAECFEPINVFGI